MIYLNIILFILVFHSFNLLSDRDWETYLEVRAHAIINKEGKDISTEDEYITVVVPTLELVQTFNTTWTNHAIDKLKTWINQLAK